MTESRILVVDSDGDHAGHCDTVLSSLGFDVTVARDTSTATQALASAAYDAVLLDAFLDPGMAAMKEPLAQSDAVVFAMSDILLGPTNRELSIALHGCADLLPKPVSSDELTTWLRRALAERFPSPPSAAVNDAATVIPGLAADAPAAAPPTPEPAPVLHAGKTPARGASLDQVAAAFDASRSVDFAPSEADFPAPETTEISPAPKSSFTPESIAESAPTTLAESAPTTRVESAPATAETSPAATAAAAFPGPSNASNSGAMPASTDRLASSAAAASKDAPTGLDLDAVGTSGGLAVIGLATVLGRLANDGATGELQVSNGPSNVGLLFDAGRLVGASSDVPEQALAKLVVSDGLVREDQLSAIARNLGEAALEEGITYVNAGLIPADTLADLMEVTARRRALHAFEWSQGTWRFDPKAVVAVATPVGTAQLTWEAVRYALPPEAVTSALADWMGRAPAWLRQPPGRAELRLTRWQRAIIGSIDGETPISGVLEGVRDPQLGLALLYTLIASGYVAFTRV